MPTAAEADAAPRCVIKGNNERSGFQLRTEVKRSRCAGPLQRHLIENFFCKLKEFKRIAMRADKTNQSFKAIVHLAAAVINSRWISTDPSSELKNSIPP